MAERLKRRWFKFMAVFCSLYLAPLSNLFTKVFTFIKPADALAVTLYCYPSSSSMDVEDTDKAATLECEGNYYTSAITSYNAQHPGMTPLSCMCDNDPSKVTTYTCTLDGNYEPIWQVEESCVASSVTCGAGEIAVAGKCYPTCIEDPANGIGYVANEPAF